MKTFFKNAGILFLTVIGTVAALLIGRGVAKSVAKTQGKLEMRVVLPSNIRSTSNAGSLNELVNKYPVRYSRKE